MKCRVCEQKICEGDNFLLGTFCSFLADEEYEFANDCEPIAIHLRCLGAEHVSQPIANTTTTIERSSSLVERSDALSLFE